MALFLAEILGFSLIPLPVGTPWVRWLEFMAALGHKARAMAGRGAAWLARQSGGLKVVGSNPTALTNSRHGRTNRQRQIAARWHRQPWKPAYSSRRRSLVILGPLPLPPGPAPSAVCRALSSAYPNGCWRRPGSAPYCHKPESNWGNPGTPASAGSCRGNHVRRGVALSHRGL